MSAIYDCLFSFKHHLASYILLSLCDRLRVIEPECVASFLVLVLQSCFGVFIQSLMTGLIFSKLARAKQRAHTIIFSRLAVVCRRDAEYQLQFRVGDMRRSHIVATSIRAFMVKDRYRSYKHPQLSLASLRSR